MRIERRTITKVLIGILVIIAILGQRASTREWFDQHRVPAKGRRILIIYTGGTIGMKKGSHGYEPKKGFLGHQLQRILHLHKKSSEDLAEYELLEFDPLLDSSDMGTKDWNKMAKTVTDNYTRYDAFIIVHGTDTMSYSASALSFALQGLQKPVIFTGSQIPLARLRNDGQNNLIASLQLASYYNIPEVMLVFGGAIMRGNRSVKLSSNKLAAFTCPNYTDIGAFGYAASPSIKWDLIRTPQHPSMEMFPFSSNVHVATLVLTPGLDFCDALTKMIGCGSPPSGLVMRTYGIGDGPTNNKSFIDMLDGLREHGVIVLNISQCLEGRADPGDYATGMGLTKHGVVSGQDMTFEAGYCKLCYLLSRYPGQTDVVRKLLREDLCGEVSSHLNVLNIDPRRG